MPVTDPKNFQKGRVIILKRIYSFFLSLILLFSLSACATDVSSSFTSSAGISSTSQSNAIVDQSYPQSDVSQNEDVVYSAPVEEGEFYYDLENVILYLEYYGCLPDNYITKDDARSLGWNGGTPERYLEGAAIGGDRFGNREGTLPKKSGRTYTECDLNTDGKSSRGAERLVFSNDGLYFHTEDHYETFTEYYVTDNWEVEPW